MVTLLTQKPLAREQQTQTEPSAALCAGCQGKISQSEDESLGEASDLDERSLGYQNYRSTGNFAESLGKISGTHSTYNVSGERYFIFGQKLEACRSNRP